jgi:hypothetical protein
MDVVSVEAEPRAAVDVYVAPDVLGAEDLKLWPEISLQTCT